MSPLGQALFAMMTDHNRALATRMKETTTMSTTDQLSQWWNDHVELARLYVYLSEHGLLAGRSDSDTEDNTAYFLEKPWKYTTERGWMLEGKAPPDEDEEGECESPEDQGAGR